MIRFILKQIIQTYRYAVSPFLGNNCRFRISCSKHMIICLEQYGLIVGFFFGALQITKCHPWTVRENGQ